MHTKRDEISRATAFRWPGKMSTGSRLCHKDDIEFGSYGQVWEKTLLKVSLSFFGVYVELMS